MDVAHAIIEVIGEDKGKIDPSTGLSKPYSVQFNPTEYSRNKSVQIAEIAIPGIESPILQFVRGQTEKLTLDLFFDTTLKGGLGKSAEDVKKLTEPIYNLTKIIPKTHAPPRIKFTWGQKLSFQAIVESVNQKFELFNPAGVPLRATLSCVFRHYRTLEEQLRELKLQSADHSKVRIVKRGDTLPGIAADVYGDPGRWRYILAAGHNAKVVTNPRRLIPGTLLELPPSDTLELLGEVL